MACVSGSGVVAVEPEGTHLTTIELPLSIDHFVRLSNSYVDEHPDMNVVLRDGVDGQHPEVWAVPK